jgi:uncharacterized membrane protein YuzA (DUF378 family)
MRQHEVELPVVVGLLAWGSVGLGGHPLMGAVCAAASSMAAAREAPT